MIDRKALYGISAGVYLFTTLDGERGVGRVVDAVSQIAANPLRVSVSLHKGGYTDKVIGASMKFSLTILAEDVPEQLIKDFGFQSSETVDKFEGHELRQDEAGVPWTPEGAIAQLSCKVIGILDVGSHLLVLGEVQESAVLTQDAPLTYARYRELKTKA